MDAAEERAEIAEMLASALEAADGGASGGGASAGGGAGLPDGVANVDICSEVEPGSEEAGKLAELRAQAEAKFGAEAVLSLTVPFGPEYIDTACLRFLRARQGDVGVALEMMEQCLDLRKREQIDTILSRPLPKVIPTQSSPNPHLILVLLT